MENILFQIRVTGILVENGKILLVKQKLKNRNWSLPGGRLEKGELIKEGIKRELKEETGLNTEIVKLLYVCEKPDISPPLIHITFLLKKVGGKIRLPSNEFDDNPIQDVKMVPIKEITEYGFTEKFKNIIINKYPFPGSYMGLKSKIGL